jgi:acyl-coenzyme A synthetase/AMP-(fatty) acid ligase
MALPKDQTSSRRRRDQCGQAFNAARSYSRTRPPVAIELDGLPRTSTGKVQKHVLRERAPLHLGAQRDSRSDERVSFSPLAG